MRTTKASDPFELDTCIKGMGVFIINSYSQIFDFCYFLTFKKSLKLMAAEFNDPDEKPITDLDFFVDVDDPIVKNAHAAGLLLIDYFTSFVLRYGLDEVAILHDETYTQQAERYAPTYVRYMRRKSYLKISLAYQHFLTALCQSFYFYACALSVNSYQIPSLLKHGIELDAQGSFKWLDTDHYEVQSIIELITALQEKELALKNIMNSKR